MASAPKIIKHAAGNAYKAPASAAVGDVPFSPINPRSLVHAVLQLQNTVDELITRFNAHSHATATTPTTTLVTGTVVGRTNLFTDV